MRRIEWLNLSSWKNIVAVATGRAHIVALKSDGTVNAVDTTRLNLMGQCDVSNWRDIVVIAAGKNYTVGVKADGTVVAAGRTWESEGDISQWTDIVAIIANTEAALGVKSDGTVVCTAEWYKCDDYKLFNSIDTLEQECKEANAELRRKEAEAEAELRRQEAERKRKEEEAKAKAEEEHRQRIAALEAERRPSRRSCPPSRGCSPAASAESWRPGWRKLRRS